MKKLPSPFVHALLAFGLFLLSGVATAAADQSGTREAAGQDALESFVREQIGDRHRAEITFGKLPSGTKLAPCRKIQPFLPRGTRLWGRTRIGVRCLAGANWTIAMPMEVRIFGEVLVATRAMRARASLSANDVELREMELTRLNGKPITDPMSIDGQMMARNIRAGQPLMSYHVRTEPTVSPGDPIRVEIKGRGFSVVVNGSAMGQGSDGQPLRVRTDAGKVIVGQLHGRTVEISM